MACQLQLNVFYTFVIQDRKFTNNKTCPQRVLSAVMQSVVGGWWRQGGGACQNVLPAYKINIGGQTPIVESQLNNLRLSVSHRGRLGRSTICLVTAIGCTVIILIIIYMYCIVQQ